MFDRLRTAMLKRLDKASARLASLDTPTTAAPQDTASLFAKGNALIQSGMYAEAQPIFREILRLLPTDANALISLGFALKEQERLTEARVYLKRAMALTSDTTLASETHFLFGQIAEAQGDLGEARQSFATAFAINPGFKFACRDLCRVLFMLGEISTAQSVLDQGLALHPDYADFHFYQGNLHLENDRFAMAASSFSEALRLGAKYADVYASLGTVQYKLGDEANALHNFQIAKEIEPGLEAEAHYQAGCFCLLRGDFLNAITKFEAALTLRPEKTKVHSSLIFCLSFNPLASPTFREAAQRYGNLLTALTRDSIRPARAPFTRGSRPLKVGFVSGEFKNHPVGFFLEGILRDIDRDRLQLIAYSNTSNTDNTTARLRSLFSQWYEIKGVPDDQAARMIRDHKLDILVDLGGHTGDNRLPIFARQPAPIQVSWLGFFASTGLNEMDYILADHMSVPNDHSEFFSEQIRYLPDTRLCMTPPVTQREILVTAPPAQLNGFVTFGCYQARTKINDQVLAVWSRVLEAVPGSVLRLQISHMQVPALRSEFLQQVALANIDLQRVSLSTGLQWEDYLADYRNVDILLDTFPYTGGTTTAEALWMGVPTVTLMGDTMLSRQGASMLNCVGLQEWVAKDKDDYVYKAAAFAGDIASLGTLRSELRERAVKSPLFDTKRYANHLQNCFEQMLEPGH